MKTLTLILICLLALPIQAQIEFKTGYTDHVIKVPDTVTYNAFRDLKYALESSNLNYERHLRKINSVETVYRDRDFVSDFKKGTIYLSYRLDSFPNTKRVAVFHEFGKIMKMKPEGNHAHVGSYFKVSADTEEKFRRQRLHGSTIYYLIAKLETIWKLR